MEKRNVRGCPRLSAFVRGLLKNINANVRVVLIVLVVLAVFVVLVVL